MMYPNQTVHHACGHTARHVSYATHRRLRDWAARKASEVCPRCRHRDEVIAHALPRITDPGEIAALAESGDPEAVLDLLMDDTDHLAAGAPEIRERATAAVVLQVLEGSAPGADTALATEIAAILPALIRARVGADDAPAVRLVDGGAAIFGQILH